MTEFLNLFHCQNQDNNSTVTKDPITPRVSLHYIVKCQCFNITATTENKTTSVTTHFKGVLSCSKADALNIVCKNCKM